MQQTNCQCVNQAQAGAAAATLLVRRAPQNSGGSKPIIFNFPGPIDVCCGGLSFTCFENKTRECHHRHHSFCFDMINKAGADHKGFESTVIEQTWTHRIQHTFSFTRTFSNIPISNPQAIHKSRRLGFLSHTCFITVRIQLLRHGFQHVTCFDAHCCWWYPVHNPGHPVHCVAAGGPAIATLLMQKQALRWHLL